MGGGLRWVGVLLTEARSLGEGGRQWGEWDGRERRKGRTSLVESGMRRRRPRDVFSNVVTSIARCHGVSRQRGILRTSQSVSGIRLGGVPRHLEQAIRSISKRLPFTSAEDPQ